jgi:transposase
MFIRQFKKRVKHNDRIYEYIQYRLIESVRTPNGPRQHVLLNLGSLDISQDKLKPLADSIEAILSHNSQQSLFMENEPELLGLAQHFAAIITQKRVQEQAPEEYVRDEEESTAPKEAPIEAPRFETVDVHSATTSRCRTIGTEHIALAQMQQLGFFGILKRCGFTPKEQMYAVAEVCGRMVHPSSERETARWLRESSALDELLCADFSRVSDNILHHAADRLWEHREVIEAQLSAKTRDLFSLDEKLILYDLTNSYFESPKRDSAIAQYGKSKEKRKDCPLVTLALVVDGHGFPKRSRIFEGNISEPGTLWEILEELDMSDKGETPRTVLIDAGIATEENLKRLREDKRFEYVAVSRKKQYAEDLFSKSEAKKIKMSRKRELTVKIGREGEETYLLCQSPERKAKEEAILLRRRERFEAELRSLRDGLGRPRTRKTYESVVERIGRLKERHKVGSFYKIEVTEAEGKTTDITWRYLSGKPKAPGEYIIRTSRTDLEEREISLLHRTLTMIESSFRFLKSMLGIRPNFHQLDRRMSAHVFISVLAYFFLSPILAKLNWGGEFTGTGKTRESHEPWEIPYGWSGVVRTMASQCRVTTSFLCQDGQRMDIRTTVEPTLEQRALYQRLNFSQRPLGRVIVKEECAE